ncbi:MAG: glycoside hydrolase family 2 TIM barrel-domain containing protein, partial [Bacteroidota bacterium]|nr:glycoside hydrolase family 2 TIM barrel-domain containing protein [Bacteroidota bacterium]
MNKILLLVVIVCVFAPFNLSAQPSKFSPQNSKRITRVITDQWTFNYFPDEKADKGYEAPGYDDSSWPAVSVPHTWSTYETTGEVHPFIRNAAEKDDSFWWFGWGWYRKHFTVKKEYLNQKVFVEFEGVQKYCKVWINGKYIGEHKGGYGSFDFDLTPYLNPGKDNVLAVAVNNRQSDPTKIPPMAAGNFDVYGGIYRDVTLVLKDNLYIPMQGAASHEGGTFVTTPSVSETKGVARVQTWVKNDNSQPRKCTLKTYIVDAGNNIVQTIESSSVIKSGELFKFDQTSAPVKSPHLWSQETPYLYKVYSAVYDGASCVDTMSSPLGFRWFSWDYQNNFLYINGKKTIVHGGNRHQEYPWVGDALPKWITEMDYRDIAENLNYNFMRTCHYPNDKLVYALADKYGIAIDEESPSIKNQVFAVDVQQQQMKEMIRRDRNHPSIMLWSMGNETNHAVDSKYAIAEDTTRILTARRVLEGSAGAYVKHTDENLSIENLLRCTIRGWYNKDVKDLEPKDSQHSGTEEHQQNMLIESGRFGTGNLCTWIYADHGCDREYVNSPLKHINPKGYVDAYRIPKYAYYLWEATYSKKPMVFIMPHFWRTQYLDQQKDIRINSNCDTVELKVNGQSLGFQYPDASNFHSVTFSNVKVQK